MVYGTELLDKAVIFAVAAHAGSCRKGKDSPYILHPLEAAAIVETINSEQELLAAAVLHDVAEDTCHTLEEIRSLFGERVAALVAADTVLPGDAEGENASWRSRKEKALRQLAAASYEAKVVALGDKLSNMRAIARDYAALGDALWSRFYTADPKDHAWYYRGLAEALSELADTAAYQEFSALIEKTFAAVEQGGNM